MTIPLRCSCILAAFCLLYAVNGSGGPYTWMTYDRFDEITDRMDAVNTETCRAKPTSVLRLPRDTLAQMPKFNKLLSQTIYPNRTDELHLHNMALNRAFFYSYIFQKLNYSEDFYEQPGLMYQYFSSVADVTANEYNINGSSICFDTNTSYPNFYRNLPFNETLELFCPHSWRYDDYNEPTNWIREPTNHTADTHDLGAGPQHNYTTDSYKINQWYKLWLPDGWDKEGLDSIRKHSYDVGIKYSNTTGKFLDDEFKGKVFFGPPSPGQRETQWLPVVYTEPYFDCGRSNRWIVSAVSPVVDQLPRYLDWFHLRRHQFVAVSVMDMEFLTIDINQCPLGLGNEPPNYFHNTARCKPNTMCEPLNGWGFRRGGYQCVCKPGYRYPPWQEGPFQGIEIESASAEEYQNGFSCVEVELQYVIPIIRGNGSTTYVSNRKRRDTIEGIVPLMPTRFLTSAAQIQQAYHIQKTDGAARSISKSAILNNKMRLLRLVGLTEIAADEGGSSRKKKRIVPRYSFAPSRNALEAENKVRTKKVKFVPRHKRNVEKIRAHRRSKRATYDDKAYARMGDIFMKKESVNKDNCYEKNPEDLELPGDVAYGAEIVLTHQARAALRLSHFISNFMQNIDMYEEYGNLRGDKLLNIEQLFGEVVANVMGDLKIKGSGIFYDVDKFKDPHGKTRQYFGPYAYRYEKADEGGPEGDRANTHFRAVDYAGFPHHYLDRPWFKHVKERWQSNTYGLDKFTQRPMIRSDVEGVSLKKFELYPMYFRSPKEEDGLWSAPYFDCNGYINDWILTYSVPFFGKNSIGTAIEFKGVVIVDIKLDELDINQCPQDFHVPNAFKDTARCHFDTTYCVALPGKRFVRGGYKCECLQGFEYPFEDRAWFYDGQSLEEEYRKMMEGQENKYDTLTCRISGETRPSFNWLLLAATVLLSVIK